MQIPSILSALHECENDQNNKLIGVMAVIKSSRASQKDAQVASMVRGMCTQNNKLVGMLLKCQNDVACDPDASVACFKLFVNDFILWFDAGFVIFQKYLACFPMDGDASVLEKPLLHCGCYPAFVDSALAVIRNPFVVDKLNQCKSRSLALLQDYANLTDQLKLNNISFDSIRAIGGHTVSCFFTLDQIVDRTKNEPLYLGSDKVEFLLLNLQKTEKKDQRESLYNALAVISVPEDGGPRSVLFPPFRVNELSMAYSQNIVKFTTLSLFAESKEESFSVSGPQTLMLAWYSKLARIFPTNTKMVSSQDLSLSGLGIKTVSDTSQCDSRESITSPDYDSETTTPTEDSKRVSEESRRGSLEIMKKTLSNNGISTTDRIEKSLQMVESVEAPSSLKADYGFADDVESAVDMESISDDITRGFEMVTAKLASKNEAASVSLPDLSVSLYQNAKPVYKNAAGSAIDINNFGKNYNPSFCSTEDLNASKAIQSSMTTKEGSTHTRTRRSSIFSIFKKNKSKDTLNERVTNTAASSSKENHVPKSETKEKKIAGVDGMLAQRPDLTIKVPKIGAITNSSDPLSATSSTFGRTLPLPFALPSSTSTYFFKPQVPGGLASSNNNSTTSLNVPDNEEILSVPNELKDIINSDESLDFYISPTSPNSLRVSRWKQKYGKWEMLTTNENLFVKIVANYVLHKSWLLVFKEEYDEQYGEVIDKPILMLNIDATAKVRQSSALDLELNSVNSITNERMLVIARCYNGALLSALKSNLENILEVMNSKSALSKSSTFNSNDTSASSLMSDKPSASSTLTSIYTALHDTKQPPTSTNVSVVNDEIFQDRKMVLLDRNTIRLHKQQESYEKIHQISSWKTITMYSLSVYHSCDSFKKSCYHFRMESQDDSIEEEMRQIEWRFEEDTIFNKIERIGKAALLVKINDLDIFMLECKGKKEFKRLYELF